MAKVGFWLRGATGTLAGSALQKGADGNTIIREIVKPTNPQTESQKIQRIIMTTVMQAYSNMKAITDHSFEGVTPGSATMAKFMSYNLNVLRQYVATQVEQGADIETLYHFCPTGMRLFAPNSYIISEGSLPAVPVVYSSSVPGAAVASAYAGIALPANTYRSFLETYGLRRGDQITLISVQGNTQALTKFYFARIILDPTNPDGSQASLDSPLVADGAINLPSPRNEGEFAGLVYGNGSLFYSFNAGQMVTTAGVIVSRKENDKWLRSPCTLIANEDSVLFDAYSLGYCLSNFNSTEIGTLNNRILNNAGQGAVVRDTVNASTFIMYKRTQIDVAEVRDVPVEVVRTEMLGGLLVAYDAQGNYYPIICMNSSSAGYGKFWKTKGSMVARNLIVANWTGFPSDVTTEEQKTAWLQDTSHSLSPTRTVYTSDTEATESAIDMQKALNYGFSMETLVFGTPVATAWD